MYIFAYMYVYMLRCAMWESKAVIQKQVCTVCWQQFQNLRNVYHLVYRRLMCYLKTGDIVLTTYKCTHHAHVTVSCRLDCVLTGSTDVCPALWVFTFRPTSCSYSRYVSIVTSCMVWSIFEITDISTCTLAVRQILGDLVLCWADVDVCNYPLYIDIKCKGNDNIKFTFT